jgi:mannose-6-phosphate isomerase
VKPILLPPNPVERFYAGGPRIARFRGVDAWSATAPEDWVGSATEAFGEPGVGLSMTPGGGLVSDELARERDAFLGPDHVARFGAEPGFLVKLLDAGVRLPVHWHPDRSFARTHLDSCSGKTEAWVIIEADPGALVYLGWRDDVSPERMREWHAEQEPAAVLAAMHRVPVAPGDTVLVPAGTPHAIGAGILLVELQEPTDFSVLLEWRGFSDEPTGDLRIGFDVALGSVDGRAISDERLAELLSSRSAEGEVEHLFPADADPYFRAERISGGDVMDAGFAIVVVVDGTGSLATDAGEVAVSRGDTLLVPWAAGASELVGDAVAIRCMPPTDPPPDGSDTR